MKLTISYPLKLGELYFSLELVGLQCVVKFLFGYPITRACYRRKPKAT